VYLLIWSSYLDCPLLDGARVLLVVFFCGHTLAYYDRWDAPMGGEGESVLVYDIRLKGLYFARPDCVLSVTMQDVLLSQCIQII
jgi:hypothetical protein